MSRWRRRNPMCSRMITIIRTPEKTNKTTTTMKRGWKKSIMKWKGITVPLISDNKCSPLMPKNFGSPSAVIARVVMDTSTDVVAVLHKVCRVVLVSFVVEILRRWRFHLILRPIRLLVVFPLPSKRNKHPCASSLPVPVDVDSETSAVLLIRDRYEEKYT